MQADRLRVYKRVSHFFSFHLTIEACYIGEADFVLRVDLHTERELVSDHYAKAEMVVVQRVQAAVVMIIFGIMSWRRDDIRCLIHILVFAGVGRNRL